MSALFQTLIESGLDEAKLNRAARVVAEGARYAGTGSNRHVEKWFRTVVAEMRKQETCDVLVSVGLVELMKEIIGDDMDSKISDDASRIFEMIEAEYPEGIPDHLTATGEELYATTLSHGAHDLFGKLLVDKTHPVHVLIVELAFRTVADRVIWSQNWRKLAKRVKLNEPACLSYEMSVDVSDARRCVIYERYVSKDDLDGPHQKSIAQHKASSACAVKPVSAKFTHFKETGIGHV